MEFFEGHAEREAFLILLDDPEFELLQGVAIALENTLKVSTHLLGVHLPDIRVAELASQVQICFA
jgi:hypothetical protein